MNRLTKRERRMLYVLLCFLIIVAGVTVVLLPLLNQRAELQSALLQKQSEQLEMQQKIAAYPATLKNIAALQQEIESLSEKYYLRMVNEKLDRLVTTLVLKHQMVPSALTIKGAAPITIAPYGSKEDGAAADTATDADAAPAEQGTVFGAQLSVTASGTRKNLFALLDAVSGDPTMTVMGFRIQEKELPPDPETGIQAKTDQCDLTIEFEVLMNDEGKK